ncbi:MAG: hypothetical protein H3Z54_09575 [archaeon]|nr:hypothetical protein [archaeon]
MSESRKTLVDIVEAEGVPLIPSEQEPLGQLVRLLNRLFPMEHRDERGRVTREQIDKTHVLWARALRDTLWIGWLSEAKRRKGVYNDQICRAIEESLQDALEIGKQYAVERP